MSNQEYKMTIPKKELIRIYNEEYIGQNLSMVKLGKKYNISPGYFGRWFKKLNLSVRSNKINSRKYNVNHSYFENIDTPEKAYWLGFIYADGYITDRSRCKGVGIALSEKDRLHLESFKRCVNAEYPILTYKSKKGYSAGNNYVRLLINSEKMFDDLLSYGVFENKTLILKRPNISEEFAKYFILGYFDGDGSIFLNNAKCPFYSISIVGTDDILMYISEHLVKNKVIDKQFKIEKRRKKDIVSHIRCGGNIKVSKIMGYLYEGIDKDIVLKRKYDLYIKCKNKQFV